MMKKYERIFEMVSPAKSDDAFIKSVIRKAEEIPMKKAINPMYALTGALVLAVAVGAIGIFALAGDGEVINFTPAASNSDTAPVTTEAPATTPAPAPATTEAPVTEEATSSSVVIIGEDENGARIDSYHIDLVEAMKGEIHEINQEIIVDGEHILTIKEVRVSEKYLSVLVEHNISTDNDRVFYSGRDEYLFSLEPGDTDSGRRYGDGWDGWHHSSGGLFVTAMLDMVSSDNSAKFKVLGEEFVINW